MRSIFRSWRVAPLLFLPGLLTLLGGCGLLDEPKLIAYSVGDEGSRDIVVARADGSDRFVVVNNPADDYAAVWSPSYDRIAYLSTRDGNAEIYISPADGSTAMRITNSAVDESQITWAPEGDRIAYVSPDEHGRPRVYWLWLNDLLPRQLIFETVSETDPAWSPQGKWIAFATLDERGESKGLSMRNPDGVNTITISSTPDRNPVWSADGERIAFVSERDGNQEIYVVRVGDLGPDGQAERVTNNPASDFAPQWSPNSRNVGFISDRSGNRDILIVSDTGENLRELTRNSVEEEAIVWGSSGQIVFQSSPAGRPQLFVTDEDGNQSPLSVGDSAATQPAW